MTAPALTPLPVRAEVDSRLNRLAAELQYAWDRTDASVARQWGADAAGAFGGALKRRVTSIFKFAGKVATGTWGEARAAAQAHGDGRLAKHLSDRASAAVQFSTDLAAQVKLSTAQVARLVQSNPREAVPQLLTLVATSLVVAGGVDGDGGAPDLDLMFGIGAHRSILSHSVLMGAALETGVLSLVRLVQLVHERLPADRDPLWDEVLRHAGPLGLAANQGASIGMAYHLFVDGLLQPGAYHDLPVHLPMEGHQAVLTANAAAEALDAANKPVSARGRAAGFDADAPLLESEGDLSQFDLASEAARHKEVAKQTFLVDLAVQDLLSDEELAVLERRGAWMAALASGELRPITDAQRHFVEVANGQVMPVSPHEQLWVTYQKLLAMMARP